MSTQKCTHQDTREQLYEFKEAGMNFLGGYLVCESCGETVDEWVESFEDMQDSLIQDCKDAGVPRQLWAFIADGAEGIGSAKELAEYRTRMISTHAK